MTKFEMFATIASLLSDNTEVVDFCNHEMELLSARKARPSKPTKTQIENEAVKAEILKVLGKFDTIMTVSEIAEEMPGNPSAQKVSALLTALKNDGKVIRTEDKRKAYFSLAE